MRVSEPRHDFAHAEIFDRPSTVEVRDKVGVSYHLNDPLLFELYAMFLQSFVGTVFDLKLHEDNMTHPSCLQKLP